MAIIKNPLSIIQGSAPTAPSSWGRLWFHSWKNSWEATMTDFCSVNSIDDETLKGFIQSFGVDYASVVQIDFTYDSMGDQWEFIIGNNSEFVNNSDIESLAGISVTIDPDYDPEFGQAAFQIIRTISINNNSELSCLELSEEWYNSLGLGSKNAVVYSSSGNNNVYVLEQFSEDENNNYGSFGFYIPCSSIEKFEFGTNPTETPEYFLSDCNNLTEVDMSYATNLATIKSHFLTQDSRLNSPLVLPSSVSHIYEYFLWSCGNMISTINIGDLPASVIDSSNYSFSVYNQTFPAYSTGMTITGTYASDWATKFPNRSVLGSYRNIIIGN